MGVWTRFYSLEETKRAVAEYFEVEKAFGLAGYGKLYGFPTTYFTEYTGFVLRVRK
ncbi:MAG: hypothetical protein ACE5G7_07450 [Candidatus Hydrothermarchaeaceae archaeon]